MPELCREGKGIYNLKGRRIFKSIYDRKYSTLAKFGDLFQGYHFSSPSPPSIQSSFMSLPDLALPYHVERCFDQRQYISLTYPRFALDSTVISLGASRWTGFVCRAKSIPQLFHVSTDRPGYKYDNTRGASGSERNNPFRSASSPDRVPCSTMLYRRACREELILIDRHVLLVVFFRRFTILEIRKRELKFHQRHGVDATSTVELRLATSRQTPSAFVDRGGK